MGQGAAAVGECGTRRCSSEGMWDKALQQWGNVGQGAAAVRGCGTRHCSRGGIGMKINRNVKTQNKIILIHNNNK